MALADPRHYPGDEPGDGAAGFDTDRKGFECNAERAWLLRAVLGEGYPATELVLLRQPSAKGTQFVGPVSAMRNFPAAGLAGFCSSAGDTRRVAGKFRDVLAPLRGREDIDRSRTDALDGGGGVEIPDPYRVGAVSRDQDVTPRAENQGVDAPVSPVKGPPISCASLGSAASPSRIVKSRLPLASVYPSGLNASE